MLSRPGSVEIAPLAQDEVIGSFSCGDADLDDFLANDAQRLGLERAVQTYLARAVPTGPDVLGFVSLMVDAVKLQTRERTSLRLRRSDHPIVPALKIARLGVCKTMQRRAGIGTALVRFAFFKAHDISEAAGCRLLTLDAYPGAVEFYERLGFVRNREKEYRDRKIVSMRLDLFSEAWPNWAE